MTTVDRVKALCKSKKIAISTLEKELGYSNGYIGKLKKGVLPDDRLVNIAKFLDVPVAYLTGWDDAVSDLNMVGMSEIDVAEEMGIDPSVLEHGEPNRGRRFRHQSAPSFYQNWRKCQ